MQHLRGDVSAPAIFATLLAGLALASYLFFGPANIGGPLVYMVTSGNSMQPYLHRGDLAIVRASHKASVGEVHAYLSGQTGQRVLHRVIDAVDDRFIFKGDNNSWIDSSQPNGAELIGKLWFRVPRAGLFLEWLQTPLHAALLAGGLTAMTAYEAAKPAKQQLPLGTSRRAGDTTWTGALLAAAGGTGRTVLGLLLGLAVLSSVALVIVWRLPADNVVSAPMAYQHVGRFDYSAETILPLLSDVASEPGVTAGTIANAANLNALAQNPTAARLLLVPVATGQPIFVNVNPRVQFKFHYATKTAGNAVLTGTIRMDAILSDLTGWSRSFPFSPEQSFAGTSADTITPDSDLAPLMSAFPIYQAITGHVPRDYTATIRAVVHIDGVIDGEEIHDVFEPEVPFRVVPPYEIYIETDRIQQFEATGTAAPKNSLAAPFDFEESGSVPGSRTEANGVSVLGREIEIRVLRVLAGGALGLAVVGMVAIVVMQWLASRRGEAFLLRARHGGQFVLIGTNAEIYHQALLINVTSMADLLRLAQYHNAPILVPEESAGRLFMVREGDRLYAYEAAA